MVNRRWGPVTRARLAGTIGIHGGLVAFGTGLHAVSTDAQVRAFALGLAMPGGGFLSWAGADSPTRAVALLLAAAALAAFLAAVILWLATGNVIAPPMLWLGAAGAAGAGAGVDTAAGSLWAGAGVAVPALAVCAWLLGTAMPAVLGGVPRRRSRRATVPLTAPARPSAPPAGAELGRDDLRLMRLILDRALQPVSAFRGFEWIDQFQTAAVRYQLNALAFALAMARSVHLPAFDGYLATAVANLADKQTDHRVWRYWALENAWGNLRLGADPIPRGNIMFTGFLAAQLACDPPVDDRRVWQFRHPGGRQYAYSPADMIAILVAQYRKAPFGLLSCEPNWIYPLCNAITATAIRAHDAATGSAHWQAIAPRFRAGLEAEFTTRDGRLVPCRSSLTGLALPGVGGVVMQAFPCLFLNALFPDIAERLWQRVRDDLRIKGVRRAVWPVDVGNYRFSRAAGYAATAAAAVEMGDGETAQHLLEALDDDCPRVVAGDVAHRPRASLWAHGIEAMARCGTAGGLRRLITEPLMRQTGPAIREARYPQVLVARAVQTEGALDAVLYPGDRPGFAGLTIGGLAPGGAYDAAMAEPHRFTAGTDGTARLNIPLFGRTTLRIVPAV
ncbi:MAG: hypothetical protein H6842_15720 [Rhodospirillaceae bacterium]|nr:hypothetical protein [Rhodospirillaceae bacterium]